MVIDPAQPLSTQPRGNWAALTLHESEAHLQLALHAGKLGSWHLDVGTGAFLDVSAACLGSFGLPPDAGFSRAALLAAVHPGDRDRVLHTVADALATSRDYAAEYRVFWPDGTLHWISEHGHPLADAMGVPTRMVGVTQEITERKATEQTLLESEERYRRLIELSPDAIWINLNGRIVLVNAGAVRLLGASSADDILGKTPFALNHPDDHDLVRERIVRMLTTGQRVEPANQRLRRFDGTYVDVEVIAVPLPYQGQTAIQAVIRDITERKRAEHDTKLAAARQRTFLKDVLASVTDGRLTLCDTDLDLPAPLTPVGPPIALSMQGGLRELRAEAQEAAMRAGLSDERGFDLSIAVGEAGMNAVVHVGEGIGQVFYGEDRVQVKVADRGPGISLEHLPKATLARGFSTKATLGHGMKMILQTVDRMFLITDATGTTVVIEQDRVASLPDW